MQTRQFVNLKRCIECESSEPNLPGQPILTPRTLIEKRPLASLRPIKSAPDN
jgi:hypothetical protein